MGAAGHTCAWLARKCRLLLARAVVWLVRPQLETIVDIRRLWFPLIIGDPLRISVHPSANVSNAVLNVRSGTITVEANVFFGQNVIIAAGTHDPELLGEERFENLPTSGHDVVIETGAWIASNATLIGPVRVGEHAVVAAGSVVTRDVAPYTIVAGVPARPMREIGAKRHSSAQAREPAVTPVPPTSAFEPDALVG